MRLLGGSVRVLVKGPSWKRLGASQARLEVHLDAFWSRCLPQDGLLENKVSSGGVRRPVEASWRHTGKPV